MTAIPSKKAAMHKLRWGVVLFAFALVAAACNGDDPARPRDTTATSAPGKVTLVTNNAFSGVSYLLDPFTEETGIEVELIAGGDAGSMVNQVILTKGNPLGDVLYGFDNTFLSRLLEEEVFVPYASPNATRVPAEFRFDRHVTAVDFGDVCINYDIAGLASAGLAPPQTLDDLRRPEYARQLVVENPATSSPGLAFMLATIAEYGEDGWLDFWSDLADNGVDVVAGWDAAYYTSWSLHGGSRSLVVSYASSPPAEVVFADPVPDVAPSGVMESSCFRQIEFIGILKGTDNLAGAQALVDWWLTDTLQAELPLNYFVYPISPDTALPESFIEHTAVPADSHILPPEEIAANRDRWIEEWTSTVLR